MHFSRVGDFIGNSVAEAGRIYRTLFFLSFPILLLLRAADQWFGIVGKIGQLLAHLMGIVGLSGEYGIVIATGMLINLYASVLLLPSLWQQLDPTTAQITVLMTMLLVAHSMPVECSIVRKAGLRLLAALVLRFAAAFLIGFILFKIYSVGGWLQDKATLPQALSPPANNDWWTWIRSEIRNWAVIFVIIQSLVILINLLKILHIEKWLIFICSPLFQLLGIRGEAVMMAIVGMLLGLSYGGGLLIDASRRRSIDRRSVLCALVFLCLCHGIIEDTLLTVLVGGDLSGVLFARVIFSILLMLPLAYIINGLSNTNLEKFIATRISS